jgi:hypothetical protein
MVSDDADAGGSPGFGKVTTLSGTGKTLVIGVPGESSCATGIERIARIQAGPAWASCSCTDVTRLPGVTRKADE